MEFRVHLLAGIVGMLSEALVFSKGEWDIRSPTLLKIATVVQIALAGLLIVLGSSIFESIWNSMLLDFSYLSGLFSAMVVYRLFLHPLKNFPGPLGARATAFWVIKEQVPAFKFYTKLKKIHEEYGDFVRIRPREISICHPDAIMDVHGPRSKIRKGEFYDQNYPHQSLQMTRDPVFHHKKRRVWDRMFSTKALHEYEPRLLKHYNILMGVLSKKCEAGTPADVEHLFMDMAFDVVSDLTFGESWDMLSSGKRHPIIEEFQMSIKVVGFIIQSMWIFHLIKMAPPVYNRIQFWMEYYGDKLQKRKEMTEITTDFYTQFSTAEGWDKDAAYDAQLAIIAGADTVGITLTNMFHTLAHDRTLQERLQKELDPLFPPGQNYASDQDLAGKPLLNGIIHETLRLHPPVASGLQRLTPPEGATIAGKYIPGDMIVTTPTYAIQRDKRAFVRPDEFIPERWSSQPELILRKDAYVPFSYGTYNCTGRPLAMMQLRMVTAMIVREFDILVPPGMEKSHRNFFEDQADCFIMSVPPLPLILQKRGS